MGGFYSQLPLDVLDLHIAILRGEYEEVEQHIKKFGADINYPWANANDLEEQDPSGIPLSSYLYRPNTDYVQFVISPGLRKENISSIILASASMNTPLHVCVCNSAVTFLGISNGLERRVEELIDLGANVNAVNSYGRTPLHYAAVWGLSEIARKLINANSDVECIDNDGRTPLHFCIEPFDLEDHPAVFFVRNISVIKMLVFAGCDLLNIKTWVEKHRKEIQEKLNNNSDGDIWLSVGKPESLKQLCRAKILQQTKREALQNLQLPKSLINYLQRKMISI